MAGLRRRARGFALQALYGEDMGPGGDIELLVENFDVTLEPDAEAFARRLLNAATQHREQIDETIQTASRNWRLERMGAVDRNILRLATTELLFFEDVPTRVIINEAIELAKRFSTLESAAFVNGILDRVAAQVRE
jgi:N utilization substance protein B